MKMHTSPFNKVRVSERQRMKHLLVCREYPPSPYPPGGIGTYVAQISELLAGAGDEVHVIAQRWEGARARVEERMGGRLVIHRVALDDWGTGSGGAAVERQILRSLRSSECPAHAFAWQVSRLAGSLVRSEGIDLIEAPEWEAPLYFFQIRQELGMDRWRPTPCLIHLHSPSELIFRYNEWDLSLTDYEPLRRSERYSVRVADAWVCPSSYLARQGEALFGLPSGKVEVIPYPMGAAFSFTRDPGVWRSDSICFLGRLELRKGVLEWAEAAVSVAQSEPSAAFEFVGSDTSLSGGPGDSVLRQVRQKIPAHLRKRFRFRGSMERGRLGQVLGSVAAVVVPSRWENLPYTCIEAMSSGLPVLVSPNGGMAELVTDGESGWVAPDATPKGLAFALRRFLETPPGERCRMGDNAKSAVHRICSNAAVLERHLELRRRVAGGATVRTISVALPETRDAIRPQRKGMAVVIVENGHPDLLDNCVEHVEKQSARAHFVAVARRAGRSTVAANDPQSRFDAAVGEIFEKSPGVQGIVFVAESVALCPDALEALECAFLRRPEAGLIAPLLRYKDERAGVAFPTLPETGWSVEDLPALPIAAVRTETFGPGFRSREWSAMLYPEPLGESPAGVHTNAEIRTPAPKRYSAIALAQSGSVGLRLSWLAAAPLSLQAQWIGRIVSRPQRLAHWLAWQFRSQARAR